MHTLNLISQDTTPVVSLNAAKAHLRITDDSNDIYIQALVERATGLIEAESNVDLRSTTWLWTGYFPHPRWHFGFASPFHNHDFVDGYSRGFRHKLILPRGPLQSVSSIHYYDFNNTLIDWTNTTDNTNYYVMKSRNSLGWIQPQLFYPATYDTFRPDAVQITFVSGYSPAPAIAQQCVLLAIGTWFENREDSVEVSLSQLPLGFDRLLDQIRIEASI